MAATQNSLLSRMRSARVPAANSSKNLTSSAGASMGHAASTVSNVSLFLTNLRLLDLDLLPDWPDINALTFTNKDAAQGQKKRTQCVEWALYQLFALWNPDDAHNVRRFEVQVRAELVLIDKRRSSSPSFPRQTSSSPRTSATPS